MKIVFEGSNYSLDTLNELHNNYPNATALIQFIHNWENGETNFQFNTSGSTGKPKPIQVSRHQLSASVYATAKYLSLEKGQTALLPLAPGFIASIMMTARCLVLDLDLILARPVANPMISIDQKVDFASFVPLQIYQMIDDGNIGRLGAIKNILIGGAPLTNKAYKTLSSINTNIYSTYGMTETVSHVALMPIKGEASEASYEILPGITIGEDSEQCLKIKGAVTSQQWIQTNDMVDIMVGNRFRWLGRRDHVINSGGVKIHPEQLEQVVDEVLALKNEHIISWIAHEKLGAACVMITEGRSLGKAEEEKIQGAIQERFSKYHVPKTYLAIDQFVRTPSGKVVREETRLKAIKSIQTRKNNS